MTQPYQPQRITRLAGMLVAMTLAGAACESPVSPSSRTPQLRITNIGPASANALTVLFAQNAVPFGDVAVGTTTGYKDVNAGVFRYAAYRFEIDGQIVTQPVIDWVGEQPMEGDAFTYAIEVDPRRPRTQIVRLISVTREQ